MLSVRSVVLEDAPRRGTDRWEEAVERGGRCALRRGARCPHSPLILDRRRKGTLSPARVSGAQDLRT